MTLKFDIVVMGSATQDVFAKSAGAETITVDQGRGAEELLAYPLGTKLLISELHFEIGGGGTNTACSFVRQGLKTAYIGKIGEDSAGIDVFKFLKDEEIVFLGAVSKDEKTGYSLILDSKDDDRTILTHKGCNNSLKYSEIKNHSFSTKWFYSSSLIGESFETMKKVVLKLKKQGTKIVFNPSSYQVKNGLNSLRHLLLNIDLLVLNKEEAELLLGLKNHEKGASVEQFIKDLLIKLRFNGPKMVCITDGKNGAHFLSEEEDYYFIEPSKSLKVVETTGAGDAFASGLVTGFVKGFSVEDSLRLAMLNAESVISKYGAKNHILNSSESYFLLDKERKAFKNKKNKEERRIIKEKLKFNNN